MVRSKLLGETYVLRNKFNDGKEKEKREKVTGLKDRQNR